MHNICIYTDGAAKGNPGRGGYGAIVVTVSSDGTHEEVEFSAGYSMTTNNRMELMAAIAALQSVTEPSRITITSDSKYLVDAFNNHWIANWKRNGWRTSTGSVVKNRDLWEKLVALVAPHKVRFIWVKGHAGHPMNERCDYLATTAAEGEHLLVDTGATPFL